MIDPFTRFGKWVVISPADSYRKPKTGKTERRSLCRCDCGTIKVVRDSKLRCSESLSCGCVCIKHGKSNSAEYEIWASMRARCKSLKNYADRGIKVCSRWDDFELFFMDMGERPSGKYSIDRKDNDGHYTPENCQWATDSQQQRNKRTNRIICFLGISLTMAEWSERTGIKFGTLWWRLNEGWAISRALGYDLSKYKKGEVL